MVVPVDPLECRELDVIDRPPRTFTIDQIGLVDAVDGLRQGIDAPIDVKRPEVTDQNLWRGCARPRLMAAEDDRLPVRRSVSGSG